jgi:hypothetical protein
VLPWRLTRRAQRDRAVEHDLLGPGPRPLQAAGRPIPDKILEGLSPLIFEHLNFSGRYPFNRPVLDRPLRDPDYAGQYSDEIGTLIGCVRRQRRGPSVGAALLPVARASSKYRRVRIVALDNFID